MGAPCGFAAPARPETRGMHQREDRPAQDPAWRHRLLAGGLDEIWTRPDEVAPVGPEEWAAPGRPGFERVAGRAHARAAS